VLTDIWLQLLFIDNLQVYVWVEYLIFLVTLDGIKLSYAKRDEIILNTKTKIYKSALQFVTFGNI